ncbi:translation initiation factor IF-2-like isoform X2 [Schistocerca gregaria]|uniref:translation initiation factor IF-2-like isoform X2 n=1 Tax=Schistocerca gregaria TaxID=7010 RepID=UPI00211ED769|nr:translation initiation factor IF-2-like isoform X2 [Schistocerca gregaria]
MADAEQQLPQQQVPGEGQEEEVDQPLPAIDEPFLQGVLRSHLRDDGLVVDKVDVAPGSGPGDNYMSTVYRAVVRGKTGRQEETGPVPRDNVGPEEGQPGDGGAAEADAAAGPDVRDGGAPADERLGGQRVPHGRGVAERRTPVGRAAARRRGRRAPAARPTVRPAAAAARRRRRGHRRRLPRRQQRQQHALPVRRAAAAAGPALPRHAGAAVRIGGYRRDVPAVHDRAECRPQRTPAGPGGRLSPAAAARRGRRRGPHHSGPSAFGGATPRALGAADGLLADAGDDDQPAERAQHGGQRVAVQAAHQRVGAQAGPRLPRAHREHHAHLHHTPEVAARRRNCLGAGGRGGGGPLRPRRARSLNYSFKINILI